MRLTNPVACCLLFLTVAAFGCKDSAEATASSQKAPDTKTSAPARSAASASADASASATTSAAPAVPPSVAAVRAGKLTNPATKAEVKLVETPLDKCFGFKGYSLMLPEGTTLKTLVGARACGAFLPDSKEKFGFIFWTDEIKVERLKRADLEKKVTKKHVDEPEAFLYEVAEDKGPRLIGWLEKKLGPYNFQCNSMSEPGTLTLDDELAAIEVCKTAKYEEKKK
jgi:hypothetical protein